MTVRVRCYGPARGLVDTDVVAVTVVAPASVADVLVAIAETFPALAPMLDHCAVALRDEIVARTHRVDRGEQLDLLPPVAGG